MQHAGLAMLLWLLLAGCIDWRACRVRSHLWVLHHLLHRILHASGHLHPAPDVAPGRRLEWPDSSPALHSAPAHSRLGHPHLHFLAGHNTRKAEW
jgi:hypothetical protein